MADTVSVLVHVVVIGISMVGEPVKIVDTWRPELWRSAFIEHPVELDVSDAVLRIIVKLDDNVLPIAPIVIE